MRRRDVLALLGAGALGGCTQLVSSQTDGSPSTRTIGSTRTTTDARTSRTTGRTETTEPTDGTETTDEETETSEQDAAEGEVQGVPVVHESFALRRPSHAELPQSGRAARVEKVCDETLEDVPDLNVTEVDGERGHMPLRTARGILGLQTCYRKHGDERFLRKAESKARALIDVGIEQDGALFFPYMVDMGGAGIDKEAPWVSAISQGPALSGFLRLAEHTGDSRYREAAEKTYESFRRLYRDTPAGEKWVATVEDGYYWLEEYPHDPPGMVLNGYLIGFWGLYEYWVDRETDDSRTLVEAALTTVAHHLDEYRVPGEVSWYSLNRGYRGNAFYHTIHVHQLGQLYELTGDERFREMKELFVEDHEPVEI